jgi:uncharacterized membrane protein YeaQ/YmgE (transglycosylase-associated protein family)
MNISNYGLITLTVVGIVAGWLGGRMMWGGGPGLVGDLIVGVIGALFGVWLCPQVFGHLGVGVVAQILSAAMGAMILLFAVRIAAGNRGWGGGYALRLKAYFVSALSRPSS